MQVQFDLRSGALRAIDTEPGRVADARSAAQTQPLPAGALRITDLGYFDTEVLRRYAAEGVFWLSRLLFGTAVFTPDGRPLDLRRWLAEQGRAVIDRPIRLGAERRVPCRLVAWPQ